MTTFQEVFKDVSTNGRWGLAIVAEAKVSWPAKGRLTLLGTFEGIKTYKFVADENGQWICVGGDLVPVAGAVVVDSESLQSGNHATIIVGDDFFVIKEYGYARRRSEIIAFKDGARIKLPATVMAAMGLIPAENKPVEVKIPSIDSPIAEALHARLGSLTLPKIKENKMGKFEYQSGNILIKGAFNIYQAKSGAIMLLMGTKCTALTYCQINDLNIDCYELSGFSHDDFEHYYLK